MDTKIEILILGVGRTKDKKKGILDYAIVDLKTSSNRKGYNVSQMWFEDSQIFEQINEEDIGGIFEADVEFVPGANGHAKMQIKHVYN